MNTTRREFVGFSLAAGLAGCAASCAEKGVSAHAPAAVPSAPGAIDIGTAADYPQDGIYDKFRNQGLFVIRKGGQITALSSICTHRGCKVFHVAEDGFDCRCHGARFDAAGHVTRGPAMRDLPTLPVTTGPDGHLLVQPAS